MDREQSRQHLARHLAFAGLWAVVLIVASYLYQGTLQRPAWGWGLAPLVGGLGLFLAWRPRRWPWLPWLILTAGEAVGVVLGSTLLAGPDTPLLLLALWPIAWAATALPLGAGLGLLAGTAAVYLGIGVWQVSLAWPTSTVLLDMVLYLATFGGSFFLLRWLPKSATAPAPAASPAAPAPTPAAAPEPPAAPPPSDDDTLHQDLRVARDIQVSLLLASSPHLPGWEASTSFLPARELGGDLYDFVQLEPPNWGIMIGDVSGKGIPAALHMAVARTLFRIEARHNPDPVQTLSMVNQSLIEQVPQGCVTLLYAQLNTTDGTLRLTNAGHNYPLILDEAVRELALDGLPLGIDRDYVFSEIAAQLMPGDVLILYTDGVVEAINEQGELFGFERLQRLLTESAVRRPRTLTRQIVRAVRAFTGPTPQSDDITLVVLRRRYEDLAREMAEVALDVLGPEGATAIEGQLQAMQLPPDAPPEIWRAAILTLTSSVRERWGQGPSRELMQQLFLTLESF